MGEARALGVTERKWPPSRANTSETQLSLQLEKECVCHRVQGKRNAAESTEGSVHFTGRNIPVSDMDPSV